MGKPANPTVRQALLRAIVASLMLLALGFACGCSGGNSSEWKLDAPVKDGDQYVLNLSPAQQNACSEAFYSIIWSGYPEYAGYHATLVDVPAEIDESGRVLIPGDPKVMQVVSDDREDSMLCGVRWAAEENGIVRYETDSLRLWASQETWAVNLDGPGFEHIDLKASVDTATGEASGEMERISAVHPLGAKVTASQLDQYRAIQYLWGYSRGKTTAADGTLAPFAEWEETDMVNSGICAYDDHFDFAMVPVSEIEHDCFLQVTVKDSDGTVHASELAQLETKGAPPETDPITVGMKAGTLSFEIHNDEATLVKYEGEDTSVEVPETVEGHPVVAVGEDAFAANVYVHEVLLPKSVTTIGDNAFTGCLLEQFEIPEGLQDLGEGAFAGCKLLRAFVQKKDGESTSVRDGVLYNADGSKLLAYPSAKGREFTVPEGVSSIGRSAFTRSDIERVFLPESLKTIEPAAFLECQNLQEIALPGGLEYIGASAFKMSRIQIGEDGDPKAGENGWWNTVRIGKNVTYIGGSAFEGRLIQGYEVDAENERYIGKDGFLISDDNELLAAPTGLTGPIQLPDGIVSLATDSLRSLEVDESEGSTALVDIVVPDTLQLIKDKALPTKAVDDGTNILREEVCGARLHVAPGSWAEEFAKENEIEYDHLRSADDLLWHEKTVSLRKATLTFRVHAHFAELVGIEAQETGHIEIPETVESVPVTTIGVDANDAASGTVKTLIIPKSVETISGTLLSKNLGIRKFELAEGNTSFSIRDGAICSADGKTLLAYPRQREVDCTVPESVEEIGTKAFSDSEIESVVLPEGVKRVGISAFNPSYNLASVTLPSSLETIDAYAFSSTKIQKLQLNEGLVTIGHDAFSGAEAYEAISIPDSVRSIGRSAFARGFSDELTPVESRTIQIGKGLETLGDGAFMGLGVDNFTVDPENPFLKADGPFLLSKDGRILYACAGSAGPDVRIPEGVEAIRAYAFYVTPNMTDVYLPESLLRMGSSAFNVWDEQPVVFHCPAGSEAALIAKTGGYTVEEE